MEKTPKKSKFSFKFTFDFRSGSCKTSSLAIIRLENYEKYYATDSTRYSAVKEHDISYSLTGTHYGYGVKDKAVEYP